MFEQLHRVAERMKQYQAMKLLRDDPTISFACKMYNIFAMVCLVDPHVFNRLFEGLRVLPWRCDDDTYTDVQKNSFKSGPQFAYNQDVMNAHFDFWYRMVFHNPSIVFKYSDDYGIGAYVKFPGVLYTYTNDFHGFVEFVSEEMFLHLKNNMHHWSLFCYRDDELEMHYCVIYGTVALINHDMMNTGKLHILNGEFDAAEDTFQLDYYWDMKDHDRGNNIVCIDDTVLTLQVIRLELYKNETIPVNEMAVREELYTRVNIADIGYYGCRIKRYLAEEQIFIDYGRNFSVV